MGIATTRIDREGNWVGDTEEKDDEYVLVRLSTDDPKRDVAISLRIVWPKPSATSLMDHPISLELPTPGVISLDEKAKSTVTTAGIVAIAKKLRKRIERKKKSDPAFCPSEISNELLAKVLDTLSWWEGKQIFWEEFEPEIEIKIDKIEETLELDLSSKSK